MWLWVLFGMVATAGALLIAYLWLQRTDQKRALQALRWIENSLGSSGHVTGMNWLNDRQFEVPIRVLYPVFKRACVQVTLPKRGLFRGAAPETLTFVADLDFTPAFSMNFTNLRWFARTSKTLDTESTKWQAINCEPVVLTTRLDWDRDVTNGIYTVLHGDRRENLNIVYRKTAPHFCATMPLEAISPEQAEPLELLDTMREMVEGIQVKKAS
jgi:hypothetical protein